MAFAYVHILQLSAIIWACVSPATYLSVKDATPMKPVHLVWQILFYQGILAVVNLDTALVQLLTAVWNAKYKIVHHVF